MNVNEFMTTRVISISPTATILEAASTMLNNAISGLMVVDEAAKLIGVITEGDLLRRSELGTERKRVGFAAVQLGPEKCAEEYVHVHGQTVAEVMTRHLITATEATPISEVVDLMERHHIRRLAVVRDEKVVGVIGRSDILRALLQASRNMPDAAASDEAIRAKLLAIYGRETWAPLSLIDVHVQNGVVELRGMIDSQVKRRALIIAARSIPGVKDVRETLTLTS